MAKKIKTREELREVRTELSKHGKKVVFTNGCFDILHRGHVEYLEKAAEYGDVLVVGLNSDQSTSRLKGKGRPLQSQDDRAYILASLSSVDYVCSFDEDTPLELIQIVEPDVLVKGGDYQLDQIVGRDFVESKGGKTVTIPIVSSRSTSEIINRMTKITENDEYSA